MALTKLMRQAKGENEMAASIRIANETASEFDAKAKRLSMERKAKQVIETLPTEVESKQGSGRGRRPNMGMWEAYASYVFAQTGRQHDPQALADGAKFKLAWTKSDEYQVAKQANATTAKGPDPERLAKREMRMAKKVLLAEFEAKWAERLAK